MCDCMTCVIVFGIHKYQISPKDWILRFFSPISHKIYTTYLRGFKTSFNKVTRINSESAFTFILSSSPWMSGAGCWDIVMRCLFTWCLPSSRWRKRILSDSETRKMCRRTWTCQWPEIQNYSKHVSDVWCGINSSYSHMEYHHYILWLPSFLGIQIQLWIWRFEVGNTIYNWQYLHW